MISRAPGRRKPTDVIWLRSFLMNLIAIAVVLRIDYENRVLMKGGRV